GLGVAGAVVADQPEIDGPGVAATPAERVSPPTRVLVIGDSAISALRWVPGASSALLGDEFHIDLESCRRLLAPSCRGREGRTPLTAYEALRAAGPHFHTVVIATGYNDTAAGFVAAFEPIVRLARAQGVQRVVWFTLRTEVTYIAPGATGNQVEFARTNQALAELVASGRFPDVVVADWAGYTAGRPDWFTSDGVHYRAVAAWGVADYLSRLQAHLHGRPCPLGTAPGVPGDAPCPDPDVTGLVADVPALYPIGAGNLHCYEVGDDRRLECRVVAT
ncbi:MAG: SGNH/GDSL hydrolase family protein, partial [Ilumatobacteraceae bacterium]|nr:SGNH/GDSL hydrolase family protein [Ilumatobacteraceae bacterium]